MEIPKNREAEIGVIGSILLDGELAKAITLESDDFYEDDCKSVYTAMQSILKKHGAIDQMTIAFELHGEGDTHLSFLSGCIANTPTSLHCEHYALIVKQCSVSRELIATASKLSQIGYKNEPIKESIEETQKLVSSLVKASIRDEILTPQQVVDNAEIRYNGLTHTQPGISTGILKLDEYTGGLFPGEYIILAARPGLGKTTLALQIASHIAKEKNVLLLTLEMTANSITDKRMVGITGKTARVIRHGNYSEDTLDKLMLGLGELSESNLYIAQGASTTTTLRGYIEKMKSSYGISAVIVDHIQLFTDKAKTRYEAITNISRELAVMSKEYNVPIIALSQLSRATEGRLEKQPLLQDLRESGALEQDADSVWFLYRDSYYTHESDDNSAELIIAKSRHTGDTGKISLLWDKAREKYYQA